MINKYKLLVTFIRNRINSFGILFSALLIILREPDLLIHPRFWAEEGCVSYAFARSHTFLEIISKIHNGYLTIFNGIISFIQVEYFTVAQAPILTFIVSFLVQLLPVYIILSSDSPIWKKYPKTILAILTIFVIPPEIWLTTTGSHFILTASSILIFTADTASLSSLKKWFFRLIVATTAVAGPTLVFIIPAIFYKCYIDKNIERNIQGIIALTLCLIQSSIMVFQINNGGTTRLNFNSLIHLFESLLRDHFTFNIRYYSGVSGLIALLVIVALIFIALNKYKDSNYIYLFIAFTFYAVLSTVGSLFMMGAERYGYISALIILLVFFNYFYTNFYKNGIERKAYRLFYTLLLFFSIIGFKLHISIFAYKKYYPIWIDEVNLWKKDPSYKPKIHPYTDDFKFEIDMNLK